MTRRAAARGARWAPLIAGVTLYLLLLTGCRPVCMNARRDLTVRGTPAAWAETVIQVAKEKAPCTPRKMSGPLPFPAGTITWREDPWNDGISMVAGTSNAYSCDLEIEVLRLEPATKSALAHEIAHWYWQWCFGKIGEVTTSDGRRIPDADLVQWFTGVNLEADRRNMGITYSTSED